MDPNQVQENNNTSAQGQAPQYLLKPSVEGLGGWLVLVQISMYFSLITITYLLFNHIFPVFEPEIWNMITDKGSAAYNQSLVQLILFETVVNVLFIIALVFALFLLYRKKKGVSQIDDRLYFI